MRATTVLILRYYLTAFAFALCMWSVYSNASTLRTATLVCVCLALMPGRRMRDARADEW